MSIDEMNEAIEAGADVVRKIYAEGCNVVSFGEMGSGNTSSSSLWMSIFGDVDLERCVGQELDLIPPESDINLMSSRNHLTVMISSICEVIPKKLFAHTEGLRW